MQSEKNFWTCNSLAAWVNGNTPGERCSWALRERVLQALLGEGGQLHVVFFFICLSPSLTRAPLTPPGEGSRPGDRSHHTAGLAGSVRGAV